jgi:hypothetical protein
MVGSPWGKKILVLKTLIPKPANRYKKYEFRCLARLGDKPLKCIDHNNLQRKDHPEGGSNPTESTEPVRGEGQVYLPNRVIFS